MPRERISPQSPEQREHGRILRAAAKEMQWWGDTRDRFPTENDRIRAVSEGLLVPIEWPNRYFGISPSLRQNEGNRYLRDGARTVLFDVCKQLDSVTGYSARRNIRLIVTSMYRHDELQESLTKSPDWYRAAPPGKSAHAAGAAFDIGIGSYYVEKEDGSLVGTWEESCPEPYDRQILNALKRILVEKMRSGECNVIEERSIVDGKPQPVCFHVCVSPKNSSDHES